MPYTSTSDLEARYGSQLLIELTDRDAPATGAIVQSVVDRALSDTDAVIDGYLAVRYTLPLSEVPALIADLAQAIAIYKLHVFMPDPKIEADYEAALRSLRDISAGKIRLPVDGGVAEGTAGTGARITDRERPMTEDNLKGFI